MTDAGRLAEALIAPVQARAPPPCAACASGNDVRQWVGIVAQRAKLGLSDSQALRDAFHALTAGNPFPATMGRICPHPCEDGCNRSLLEGAVSVHELERFIGDWALAHRVRLRTTDARVRKESVGVIGAGPAGLSFAWQMLRRGYRVTVYEKEREAGGMLWHGIPEYRLPGSLLEAEIGRLVAAGLDLRLGSPVADGARLQSLRVLHDVIFVGIGAARAARLGVAGEEGPGVMGGIEFLRSVNLGEAVALESPVVVVGGGNTAMDAARTARRAGAEVTVAYRRTRDEMPAIGEEVEQAMAEGVRFMFLRAPAQVVRIDGRVGSLLMQCMALSEPDAGGRRGVRPVNGAFDEVPCRTVIAAVSQVTDWQGLEPLQATEGGNPPGPSARIVYGGDVVHAGIAGEAIAQGRRAADAVHATLSGMPPPQPAPMPQPIPVKPDFYEPRARVQPKEVPVARRLAEPSLECQSTLTRAQFFAEAARCFSCGSCFGCEQCFMYCNAGGFHRRTAPWPGNYFELDTSLCEGCRKCVQVCPCGYLTLALEPIAHRQMPTST